MKTSMAVAINIAAMMLTRRSLKRSVEVGLEGDKGSPDR
jgi:hypothetical protein